MFVVILDFIKEYLLIFYLHLQGIFLKPPTNWNYGTKGDVILIPGFGEPWTFLKLIGEIAHALGYKVHVVPKLTYNLISITESVDALEKYFNKSKLSNVILIGHSKGGLIIQKFLDTSPFSIRVKKAITITTPFLGTIIGYVNLFSLWEIRPHPFTPTDNLNKIVNIYAKNDNHVIPNKNAILPNGDNKMINIFGHTRILQSQQMLNEVRKILS